MRSISTSFIAVYLTTIAMYGAQAQQSSGGQTASSPATLSSTRAGVYTAAQAERGRVTYAGMCRSCHTPASHTGTTFEKLWVGRTVADLFGYMSTQMPKNDPGALNPDQYADVLAYLLKMNTMPAGKTELPGDSTALAAIRIDKAVVPRKPSKQASTRKPAS